LSDGKPAPRVAKFRNGKSPVTLVLPEPLIAKIYLRSARERVPRSHVFERLLMKGLQAEARAPGSPSPEENDVA
jgi:hypothetical protein